MIHIVKGFSIINKAEIDAFFWNSLAFSMIQWMLAIWSLIPLPFLNSDCTSGSSWFTYCWMCKDQKIALISHQNNLSYHLFSSSSRVLWFQIINLTVLLLHLFPNFFWIKKIGFLNFIFTLFIQSVKKYIFLCVYWVNCVLISNQLDANVWRMYWKRNV